MALKVYLAGPDVFLADALEVGRKKQALCRQFGFDGLFPLDQDEKVGESAEEIFRANCALMHQSDVGLFNLTPFRSPSADPGTVFELGFMFAQDKPVYGYANGKEIYRDRVADHCGRVSDRNGTLWGPDGYSVENFGLSDNLMIERAIIDAGGDITIIEEGESLAAFRAFEACLEKMRTNFAFHRAMTI